MCTERKGIWKHDDKLKCEVIPLHFALNSSNNKLYFRTIGIIQKLIGVDENTAKFSLLKAIHDRNSLDEVKATFFALKMQTILNLPISHHIEVATPKALILPIAMLLASGKFSIESAKKALEQDPVVRNIIKNISQNQQ